MRRLHLYFLPTIVCSLFLACQSEENPLKNQNFTEELVQIEQNDEKTQISDSNLPLPIEDGIGEVLMEFKLNSSVVNFLYKKKCASCHGKKGELRIDGSRVIKDLDKSVLVRRLSDLERDKSKNHVLDLSQDQIQNLAEFISKGN